MESEKKQVHEQNTEMIKEKFFMNNKQNLSPTLN